MSPSDRPKADNRQVLIEYSDDMKRLLTSGKYSAGKRPSEHKIGERSFLKNNGGAIPGNVLRMDERDRVASDVLQIANTRANDPYQNYCRSKGFSPHPARMPLELSLFFIKFLTEEGDLVVDPFAGSNTTGAAAELLHRRWLSIEASVDYVESSRGRFQYSTLV
jgi:site-specific DNA-methyltransferase (cytosine-N4-specific)